MNEKIEMKIHEMFTRILLYVFIFERKYLYTNENKGKQIGAYNSSSLFHIKWLNKLTEM